MEISLGRLKSEPPEYSDAVHCLLPGPTGPGRRLYAFKLDALVAYYGPDLNVEELV